MSNVGQWVSDLETHFKSVVATGEQFLSEHVPGLISLAQKVEASPLLTAALGIAEVIDPAAETVLAKALADLAHLLPPKPADTPAPDPEPAPAAPAA